MSSASVDVATDPALPLDAGIKAVVAAGFGAKGPRQERPETEKTVQGIYSEDPSLSSDICMHPHALTRATSHEENGGSCKTMKYPVTIWNAYRRHVQEDGRGCRRRRCGFQWIRQGKVPGGT
jgi:hypothetical protein